MDSSNLKSTPFEDIETIRSQLVAGFRSGKLKDIAYRKEQIVQLGYLLRDNSKRFEEALAADLGRPALESGFLELEPTIAEITTLYTNVEKWAKPEKPPFNIKFAAMRPVIRKEPKGVILIISPFNFPVFLSICPAAGAIAAGNTVLLKPSEKSPAVSSLMTELAAKYMDPDIFRIVNGGAPETTRLLELQWDHIMYCGSAHVGKVVMAAAAKYLTPVSLELGGKCPVIVDPRCDLPMAARRVLWGKCVNAGQVCVAPDYVLVPEHFQDEFVEELKNQHRTFFPDSSPPSADGAFSRLVSPEAFSRVEGLIKHTKGTVVLGGETDAGAKYVAPTVIRDVKGDDVLMGDEIFGPVLPIVPVKDVDEAIAFVNARAHPLALYVFSRDDAFKRKVFDNTTSGAAIANETGTHPGIDGLPFGGIGPSGTGCYTGKFSFDTFSYLRASLDTPGWVDRLLAPRYPPYTAKKQNSLRKMFGSGLPPRPNGTHGLVKKRWGKWFLLGVALVVLGVLTRRGSFSGFLVR